MEIKTFLLDEPYECAHCGKDEAALSIILAHVEKYLCPTCIKELKRVLSEFEKQVAIKK